METVIEARSLSKSFNSHATVSNLTFQVKKGECFGFLGPNGAGKSTLMKMIYGSCQPSAGDLFVLGMNVKDNVKKIKELLGVLPQDSGLDSDFVVMDNLLLHAEYYGISSKRATLKTRELLRLLHLHDIENRSIDSLSKGSRRRLDLVRALLTDPEIIILDEPTNELDRQEKLWIWQAIEEMKAQGKTFILSTRDMEEAERLCHRLILIEKGENVCEGIPNSLIRQHIGREVVEFFVHPSDLAYHVGRVRNQYGYQVVNNKIKLFIPENDDGRSAISLIVSDRINLRRASLSDVFLKLTGIEMKDFM